MDKAIKNLIRLLVVNNTQCEIDTANFWCNCFKLFGQMSNANSKFKRIANASDKEQLNDYLAEIRYTLIFAGLGFQVAIEPLGKKGPDLKISRNGYDIFVEVSRFRLVDLGPGKDSTHLEEYGNLEKEFIKTLKKILGKFRQVGGKNSAIAIWNDDECIDELSSRFAVKHLNDDKYRKVYQVPDNLLFVIYGSNWINISQDKQLYCYPLQVLKEPFPNLTKELESCKVSGLIQNVLNQVEG